MTTNALDTNHSVVKLLQPISSFSSPHANMSAKWTHGPIKHNFCDFCSLFPTLFASISKNNLANCMCKLFGLGGWFILQAFGNFEDPTNKGLALMDQIYPNAFCHLFYQERRKHLPKRKHPCILHLYGDAPKERRRGRAETRLSKRVFLWRVRFFSAPFKVCSWNTWRALKTLREQRRNGLSKNTLLDNRFSARPLRRSFGAPWL